MSRLPVVSSDGNAWGTILNDFLGVSHNSDGTLKNLFVNVTDPAYGASPSNTAAQNDTAFAAAIAALPSNGPGILFFPCIGTGIYNISQPIIVDKDYIALIAFGQRGIVTIQIDSSADPAYALIVGNTKNTHNCTVQGLSFLGRANTTSTGAGINFRSDGGSLKQVQVAQFGGTGLNIAAFSGTIVEVYTEDLDLVQNGRNTTTPGDNMVIASSVSDSEHHRVITAGDSGSTTVRHGITNMGTQQRFVDCHAYHCNGDGLHNSGSACAVIGGEWETNTNDGINNTGTFISIHDASFYGNTIQDINLSSANSCIVDGCTFTGIPVVNIDMFTATDVIIGNNVITTAASTCGIRADAASSKVSIHDTICNSGGDAIRIGATNCDVHDNLIETGNITEITGANTNNYHDNTFSGGGTFTKIGSASVFKNNRGYNPVGQVTAPTFPATTVAVTNTTGVDVTAYIANGTAAITVIQIAGRGGTYVTTGQQIALSSWGNIRIPAGGGVKFTYASGSPSWTWFGD